METNARTTAETILAQLGGNRFTAMTGARNLVFGTDSLSMEFRGNAKKVAHVRITLVGPDLYATRFLALRGMADVRELSRFDDLSLADLRRVFQDETGLPLGPVAAEPTDRGPAADTFRRLVEAVRQVDGVIDDGSVGSIVQQALRDNPRAMPHEIAAFVIDAQDDAAAGQM